MYLDDPNDLSALSCFRIRPAEARLSRWKPLFQAQPARFFPKGSVLVAQGCPVGQIYYLWSGFLEYTYSDAQGDPHLIDLMSCGNICGVHALFSRSHKAFGAFRALTDVSASCLPARQVRAKAEGDPLLCRELLEELSRVIEAVMTQSYTQSVESRLRVVQILAIMAGSIARQQGHPWENILIPLSQSDLARITHTSRITITKLLKSLREEGLIFTTYGGIIVRDLEQLQAALPAYR